MFDAAVGVWVTLIVVLIIVAAVLGAALFIVPQQQAYIIERFGKFNKVQFAGIHLKIPFVDRIAMKTNMRVSQINVQLETKTLDNVFVTVVASRRTWPPPTTSCAIRRASCAPIWRTRCVPRSRA